MSPHSQPEAPAPAPLPSAAFLPGSPDVSPWDIFDSPKHLPCCFSSQAFSAPLAPGTQVPQRLLPWSFMGSSSRGRPTALSRSLCPLPCLHPCPNLSCVPAACCQVHLQVSLSTLNVLPSPQTCSAAGALYLGRRYHPGATPGSPWPPTPRFPNQSLMGATFCWLLLLSPSLSHPPAPHCPTSGPTVAIVSWRSPTLSAPCYSPLLRVPRVLTCKSTHVVLFKMPPWLLIPK